MATLSEKKLKVTDSELKTIELQILDYFKDVCVKENIQFFLTYGSLLGAARHSGFIPWDDDIDLMVRREDFQKLIFAMNKNPSDRFKFICLYTNKRYLFPLAKVYDTQTELVEEYGSIAGETFGVNIDVFILDHLPDDRCLEQRFFSRGNFLRYYYGLACCKYKISRANLLKDLMRNIIITPFKLIGYRFFAERYDKFCQKYNNKQTEYVGIIQFGEGSGDKERIPNSSLSGMTTLPFEGKKYSVPDNYKIYLTQLYGDFMVPPPEEKRITKHSFVAYWL
ncbi:LicD family protein [Sphaerochaeta globosa]|uniref:LicD family protein n=1 Tax=Sphaerochaeta globosa (strain ATCC BAA-1886 / DSM 22777 / Buddy) TaxID=158189 RepID=F0RXQ5_SPHGB|nr:LicD family protein [Sphaerochaeta globosa]ADY12105.1 LicD family protein [Sphaerochaeta globosa str. Buddy]